MSLTNGHHDPPRRRRRSAATEALGAALLLVLLSPLLGLVLGVAYRAFTWSAGL